MGFIYYTTPAYFHDNMISVLFFVLLLFKPVFYVSDGFLAKYCIFNKGSMEAYRRTFESVS
jgi:hypothetical protein